MGDKGGIVLYCLTASLKGASGDHFSRFRTKTQLKELTVALINLGFFCRFLHRVRPSVRPVDAAFHTKGTGELHAPRSGLHRGERLRAGRRGGRGLGGWPRPAPPTSCIPVTPAAQPIHPRCTWCSRGWITEQQPLNLSFKPYKFIVRAIIYCIPCLNCLFGGGLKISMHLCLNCPLQ